MRLLQEFILRAPFAPILALAAILAPPALAQDGNEALTEFWPEANAFLRLNEDARLIFFSSWNSARDVDDRVFESGIFVDLFVRRFRPVLFRGLANLDESRAKRMTLRAGYRYVSHDRPEHRLQTDATIRWAFPENILLSNRGRAEYRFIQGDYSWRYRDELKLERDFSRRNVPVTPYISAELFYDSRYETLSRWRYSGGAVFSLGRHWALDAYYTYQVGKHPTLRIVHAVGLTVNFYGP